MFSSNCIFNLIKFFSLFADNADSCSIHCVIFSKHNEVLTSNLRGQLKIWDLRTQNNIPSSTFMLSGDQVTPTCLTFHPTQRHMILAGDDLGKSLYILCFNKKYVT